ncbi:MAG: hypothetical protein KJ826_19660 [Proteobacteria bacterium]|nr:hypothetical protein [Pseudomonadota bacterium]
MLNDDFGRVIIQTLPRQGGGTADYSFYFSGYRNQEVDPDGNALTYYYDHKGREYAQEDPLGNKFTKTFDGQDHVIKTVDPKGNISEFEYDGNQNLISTKSPLSGTEYDMEFDYDALFRKTDSWYALNSVRQKKISHLDYDAEHHPIMATSYPESDKQISTSTTPYPNGFPNTVTDGRGVITTITYDAVGNPNTSRVSAEPVIDYDYDSVGRMVQLTDQAGAITRFAFDRRGLLLSKTDPLGKSTTLTYYNDGSLHTKTDRNNNTITLSYTQSGNPETITYPDASEVNFTYNQLDNLESMQDSTGTTGYIYDAVNRLTSKTDPFGFNVSYEYDEAGNVTKLTYPGNKSVSYTYDELNRMKTVTLDWLSQTATYNYDAAGRLASIDNFNGTTSTYDFDDANRLVSLENRQQGGAAIATYQFDLDENGNRTNIIKDEPLTDTAALENTNYTYNTYKNRLLSDGANSFGYDDEGQITNGYGSYYTFDYDHRLTAIGSNYVYSYDATGNRLKALRNGVETRYIYDAGGNLLAEADNNNVITRYYIYGQGLMAMVTPSDQVYCYHYNTIGSTVAMTDSSQNIVNKYAYDEFGNINNEVEAVPQPFKYVGQFGVMAEPNGFYYMRARYYDPQVGRFISEDPIGFDGGDVNLMAYVGNNPTNLIDPNGELAFFWHGGITLVAALNSGRSIRGSLTLALSVMAEDSNSTDRTAPAANTHAMSGFDSTLNRYQTQGEALANANNIIQSGFMPSALHVGQDLPGHNGESMQNWGWNWSTVKHVANDVFPSLSTISNAYQNSMNTLK